MIDDDLPIYLSKMVSFHSQRLSPQGEDMGNFTFLNIAMKPQVSEVLGATMR